MKLFGTSEQKVESPEESPIVKKKSAFGFRRNKNNEKKEITQRFLSKSLDGKNSSTDVEGRNDELTSPKSRDSRDDASVISRLFRSNKKDNSRAQAQAVYRNFSPDATAVLEVENTEGLPELNSKNDVLIKVQASTVTVNDCLLRHGVDFILWPPTSLPITPGFDVVGTIVQTGSEVSEFEVGDRVAALVRTGGNARFVSVTSTSLVSIPKKLDAGEAASLVSIYTTAYQALRKGTMGKPMFSLEDHKILIHGNIDNVSQALMQLCIKAGATVYVPSPEQRRKYMEKVLGVQSLPEDDFLDQVESQMDIVFDCNHKSSNINKALKKDGKLVVCGSAHLLDQSPGFLGAPLSAHMSKLVDSSSVDIWESFQKDPKTFKADLQSLCRLLKFQKIQPHIAKRVGLSEVASAQTSLEQGDVRGIVVCYPWRKVNSDERQSA